MWQCCAEATHAPDSGRLRLVRRACRPVHAACPGPLPRLQSDIVSLHCPLMASTFHIINAER